MVFDLSSGVNDIRFPVILKYHIHTCCVFPDLSMQIASAIAARIVPVPGNTQSA
jgi:hypothetical protein